MPTCIHGKSRCKPCGKDYCIEYNTRNDLCIPCGGKNICEQLNNFNCLYISSDLVRSSKQYIHGSLHHLDRFQK